MLYSQTNLPNSRKMKSMVEDNAKAFRGVPSIIVESDNSRYSMDPFSRLLENRIIFYTGSVDEVTAELVRVQLLYLEAEKPNTDIQLYVDSPGGQIYRGDAVIDVMNFISSDVVTICNGMAMSMGAMTLVSGAEGKRLALPNARILIHQPLSGAQGQSTQITIAANETNTLKVSLLKTIAERSGASFEEVLLACERDNYMSPREALEFGDKGIIDQIIVGREAGTLVEGDENPEPGNLIKIGRGDPLLDKYFPDISSELALVVASATPDGMAKVHAVVEKQKAAKAKKAK